MRTITNALLTAQTAASGRPHVRVEALDMLAGVARLNATHPHRRGGGLPPRRNVARRRLPRPRPHDLEPTAPSGCSAPPTPA